MPVPGAEDWRKIAGDYEKLADFPNCLGAIDGKHVDDGHMLRVKRNSCQPLIFSDHCHQSHSFLLGHLRLVLGKKVLFVN
ncbi:unnamed protein product [Arctogadus glacialis]